jgi:hypothetical protein
MRPTKWSTIALIVVVSGVISWAGLDLFGSRLAEFLAVPWTVPAALVSVGVVVVALAWPVRQYVKGHRKQVDRFRAATVVALGKSCTLSGSALVGFYGAMAVLGLVNYLDGGPLVRVWQAGAAALAALMLVAAGRIAEWFCQLPPTKLDEEPGLDQAGAQAA